MMNDKGEEIQVFPDKEKPLAAMAFKITDETFGQLTYTRIYQGTMKKGESYLNPRLGKKQRIGRIVRMNSNDREDLTQATAGDIIAVVGVDCASGDTFCDDFNQRYNGKYLRSRSSNRAINQAS